MIGTKRVVAAFTGMLAVTFVCFTAAALRSDETVLVRVEKVQRVLPPSALVARMQVLQEFDRAWLVRMAADDAAALPAASVAHEILRSVGADDVLFLVSSSRAADVAVLSSVGEVWPIDDANSLLVSADENVRERVPAHLRLKHLAEPAAITPTFRVAGQGLASPRASLRDARTARLRPAIAEMVDEVSRDAIAANVSKLESFQTRFASLPACGLAGTWLADAFSALGLSVQRDDFVFGGLGYPATNIVATLPGRTSPDQVVIVGAHYDSYSNDTSRLAPGADDNGSGVAAVLELARVMSRRSFDFTIRFVAFSAEEWGLYGSKWYAQAARRSGQQIVAVVNLDMIGYADRLPEDLDLITNAKSEWLANTFIASASTYAPMPTLKVVNPSLTYSDHAPFWDQGYSAICGIEDANPSNPNYHKTTDTLATLNMDFAQAVVRASLATVATLAQPLDVIQPPATVTAQGQIVGAVLLRARTVYLNWSTVPAASGYNVYRSAVTRGPYQKVNRTPVTTTSFVDRLLPAASPYYYVVTSIDGRGNEGNYSQEVGVAGIGR